MTRHSGPVRRLAGAAVLSAAMAVVGCGGGTASVSGKVTYKDKPVVVGSVTVVGSDGVAVAAALGPDGTYTVDGLKPGTARFAVLSNDPKSARGGPGPRGGPGGRVSKDPEADAKDAANWVAIPSQYADPDKSGLSTNLKSGPNTFDLVLK